MQGKACDKNIPSRQLVGAKLGVLGQRGRVGKTKKKVIILTRASASFQSITLGLHSIVQVQSGLW